MLFVYVDIRVPYFVVRFEVAFQFIPRILKYKLEDPGLDSGDLFPTCQGDPANTRQILRERSPL